MLRKNKILFVLFIITILFSFIFANSSYASFEGPFVTTDGYSYDSFPDLPAEISNYKYYLICNYYDHNYYMTRDNRIVLLYSNEPFYYRKDGDRFLILSSDMCDLGYYFCIDSYHASEWVIASPSNGLWRDEPSGAHFYSFDNRNPVIYISNSDVYYDENREEVFFQKTPEEVQETVLAKITRESHPEEIMLQIVKILPLILVAVVSFLGLRKALALLSNILHRA